MKDRVHSFRQVFYQFWLTNLLFANLSRDSYLPPSVNLTIESPLLQQATRIFHPMVVERTIYSDIHTFDKETA